MWSVRLGDCIEQMRELPAESIDSVVTDPPYGIGFMGHEWDQPGDFGPVTANGTPAPFGSSAAALERQVRRGQRRGSQRDPMSGAGHEYEREAMRRGVKFGGPLGQDHTTTRERGGAMHAGRYDLSPTANQRFQEWCEAWAAECLRVLKPGGYLVSFGGTRTYHRMASGIEDAGYEIRDQLAWLFGSGFPKSLNVERALMHLETGQLSFDEISPEDWAGWGTALKPGHEPVVLARKPLVGTVAENVRTYGTGALNIDASRIPLASEDTYARNHSGDRGHAGTRPMEGRGATDLRMGGGSAAAARWPANVVMDEAAGVLLDGQTGILTSGANPTRRSADKFGRSVYGNFAGDAECEPARGVDRGGASRFYYCAKTSRAERSLGLSAATHEPGELAWSNGNANPGAFQSEGTDRAVLNHHPTVKPIDLMRWLCRLITPPGGRILDPFTGSGSTGCAAVLEGFEFIGTEREAEYVAIAEARIGHWATVSP